MRVFLLLFFLSPQLFGWGEVEHRASGRLIWAGLDAQTRARIAAILVESGEGAFLRATYWADVVRYEARAGISSAVEADRPHYINLPVDRPFSLDSCYPQPGDTGEQIHKKREDCLIDIILREAEVVGNKTSSAEARRNALMGLIHRLQDLSQPLHLADGIIDGKTTLGGNRFVIRFVRGQEEFEQNIHALWDSDLPRYKLRGTNDQKEMELFKLLSMHRAPKDLLVLSRKGLERWARESFERGRVAYQGVTPGARLNEGYLLTQSKVAREALAEASYRIAYMLNRLLAE